MLDPAGVQSLELRTPPRPAFANDTDEDGVGAASHLELYPAIRPFANISTRDRFGDDALEPARLGFPEERFALAKNVGALDDGGGRRDEELRKKFLALDERAVEERLPVSV